jgi:hypothetical protein
MVFGETDEVDFRERICNYNWNEGGNVWYTQILYRCTSFYCGNNSGHVLEIEIEIKIS